MHGLKRTSNLGEVCYQSMNSRQSFFKVIERIEVTLIKNIWIILNKSQRTSGEDGGVGKHGSSHTTTSKLQIYYRITITQNHHSEVLH